MRAYKFRELIVGKAPWNDILSSVETLCLRPPVQIYQDSITRTANLAVMPAMIAFIARRDQLYISNARFKVEGKGYTKLEELGSEQFTDEIVEAVNEQIESFSELPDSLQKHLKGELGARYIEFHLKDSPPVQSSIEAILTSIVIESWTAFESLASDLWVAALDEGPKAIANRMFATEEFKRGEPITVKMLRDLEYDARRNLGKFLRETRRVTFQSLDSIRRAYIIAFADEAKNLFHGTNNGYIEALSAFRNVFVHRSGKADKEFVRQIERFPEFRSIKVGDQIQLDGELVAKLRVASVLMAQALVTLVDDSFRGQCLRVR